MLSWSRGALDCVRASSLTFSVLSVDLVLVFAGRVLGYLLLFSDRYSDCFECCSSCLLSVSPFLDCSGGVLGDPLSFSEFLLLVSLLSLLHSSSNRTSGRQSGLSFVALVSL